MVDYVYRRRSLEEFNSVKDVRGGAYDSYIKPGIKRYKMKEGKNVIRFLPPTWDMDPKTKQSKSPHYAYEIWVNFKVGPQEQRYLSLSQMKQERDPLLEARRRADPVTAKKLLPNRRWLGWIIDREAEEEGPQLFEFPNQLNTAIGTAAQDEDTRAVVYIDDPSGEGADVRFYKEGQDLNTKYPGERIKLLSRPLSEDEDQAAVWLAYTLKHPIPDCLVFHSYDHILAEYNGTGSSGEPEDDDPRVEAPPQKAVAPKQPQAEEQDIPWDDDDVVPAPKAKLAVRPPPNLDDDDDDDRGNIRDRLTRRRQRLQEAED